MYVYFCYKRIFTCGFICLCERARTARVTYDKLHSAQGTSGNELKSIHTLKVKIWYVQQHKEVYFVFCIVARKPHSQKHDAIPTVIRVVQMYRKVYRINVQKQKDFCRGVVGVCVCATFCSACVCAKSRARMGVLFSHKKHTTAIW